METNTSVTTEASKTQAVEVAKPRYQMGLFELDKFSTTPKVARAFGIKEVYGKDGITIVGFANSHLKRKEIADKHAEGLTGAARRDKVDQIIRESEIEMAAYLTTWLVANKGKVGAKSLRVRKDPKTGIKHYAIGLRDIPDTMKADLQRLMDAYQCKTPEELVDRLTKGNQSTVELETTATGVTKK